MMNIVAQTILQQLGGRIFMACTGVHNLIASNNTLVMKFKQRGICRPKNGATHMRIVLNGRDLYDVDFFRIKRDLSEVGVSDHNDIYNDMLVELFESETGLMAHF